MWNELQSMQNDSYSMWKELHSMQNEPHSMWNPCGMWGDSKVLVGYCILSVLYI
jgi:hypothetical protein